MFIFRHLFKKTFKNTYSTAKRKRFSCYGDLYIPIKRKFLAVKPTPPLYEHLWNDADKTRSKPKVFTFDASHIRKSQKRPSSIDPNTYYKPSLWPDLPWRGYEYLTARRFVLKIPITFRTKSGSKPPVHNPVHRLSSRRALGTFPRRLSQAL